MRSAFAFSLDSIDAHWHDRVPRGHAELPDPRRCNKWNVANRWRPKD